MSLKHFAAYLNERWPLQRNVPAITLLTSATLLASLIIQEHDWAWDWRYLAALGWALALFYRLRVLDDLKDREDDLVAHPDRVLSRGLVSYRQLAWTGVAAFVVETVCAALISWWVLLLHGGVALWSILMYREFFVKRWLKARPFLYAVLHLLILFMIDFTILQSAGSPDVFVIHSGFFLFAGLSFLVTFSLEVSRKIRVPEAERPEVETYSKLIGVRGSMIFIVALQGAALLVLLGLSETLHLFTVFWIPPVAAWLGVAIGLWLQSRRLTDERSKKLDRLASLFYVGLYLSLITNLAVVAVLGSFA